MNTEEQGVPSQEAEPVLNTPSSCHLVLPVPFVRVEAASPVRFCRTASHIHGRRVLIRTQVGIAHVLANINRPNGGIETAEDAGSRRMETVPNGDE